jgi:hypothetical protein
MLNFYVSLVMLMATCFVAGIEFARFLFQRNKQENYEKLKAYFESKEGEAYAE